MGSGIILFIFFTGGLILTGLGLGGVVGRVVSGVVDDVVGGVVDGVVVRWRGCDEWCHSWFR